MIHPGSQAHPTHVKWLFSTGEEAFYASVPWRGQLTRAGIRCSRCEAVRPDAMTRLSEVIVERVLPNRVLSYVWYLRGGQILRCDLIDLIGRDKLESLCQFVPVRDEKGNELRNFRFLMERTPRGLFRGSSQSEIGICPECGRLMYCPIGKWYLLRQYWDGSDGVTEMNNDIVCTPEYFREVLGPKHFPGLRGETRAFTDAPEDGFPAACDEMIAAVKARGLAR